MSRLSSFIRGLVPRRRLRPPTPTSGCKPPLVLHIGPHKTGTTAIQQFCTRNRKQLAKAGFWYPQVGLASGQHMMLPGCYLSQHHCIPEPLLGGCPDEMVATIAADAPRGLTPLISSEVFWELLCVQPESFTAAVSLLDRYFQVQIVVVDRSVRDRLWSAVKFNARLGFACDVVADFKNALDADRDAWQRLMEMGRPVTCIPYEDADCIAPFLKALSSQFLSRKPNRLRKVESLIERCHAASSTQRVNAAPSEPWFVAFTMEFAQRLLAARGPRTSDRRITSFLHEAMVIGNELEGVRRLPDEDAIFRRVFESSGGQTSILNPAEVQAWESICKHPAVQLAAMRAGCIDELRAVTGPVRRGRLAA